MTSCIVTQEEQGQQRWSIVGGQGLFDVLPWQHIYLQWGALGSFWAFYLGSLGTGGRWNQDTTLQTQAVPVRGEVSGAQDHQRRCFNDPKIRTEDQELTVPKTGKEFAGYYRTFIPQYSALMNRLNGIRKAEKFMWNEEIE